MRRRDFTLSGAAALLLPPAIARGESIKRIGFLGSGMPYRAEDSGWMGAQRGLADSGYVDGRNLACDYRFAEGHDDRSPGYAAELVALKLDLVAASGNSSAAFALRKATSTIPIVFITGADPVATGLVDSLAHPGGNITGVTLVSADLNLKRFEVLTELFPDAKSIGVLINPHNPLNEHRVAELNAAAQRLGIAVHFAETGDKADFDSAFAALSHAGVAAATNLSDTMYMSNRQPLIDLAARYKMPMIYETRDFAVLGGLITYGADLFDLGYREGIMIGKVLNGANPGDLPVEQSSKFQLTLNMKTAQALGLTVPRSILARAEIIE